MPCLPESSVLIDQCRKHYALVARRGPRQRGNHKDDAQAFTAAATVRTIAHVLRAAAPFLSDDDKGAVMKQIVSMTLDTGCPVALAQELLAALVALADRDPAKILEVYGSRLCFYCDSQTDPNMRDQVAEVGGMIRALEHFTRVLFTGGQSDLCAQFLYADVSSTSLGAASFSSNLSEEDLNDLLCGRKDYPHVAQLINGCLVSRLASVRRCAYETLSNVALFAKAHRARLFRGPKAFDMLLRLRLGGAEKDPRLIAVLAALVWEVVFVDQALQDERLVGSGTPGSYGLLDDLFAESVEVRLVAFHSVSRLLFHAWISKDGGAVNREPPLPRRQPRRHRNNRGIQEPEGGEGNCDEDSDEDSDDDSDDDSDEDRDDELRFRPPGRSSSPNYDDVPACAEQAVLRVSLILHETTTANDNQRRRFDPRVRAAARSLASGLQARKRRARHLLERSVLLVVDHGLANGSLDGLRVRFPPPTLPRSRGGGGGVGLESPSAMSVSSSEEDGDRGNTDDGTYGDGGGVAGGRFGATGLDDGGRRRRGRELGGRNLGSGAGGVQSTARLSKDALQYASAVHFLVAMLSKERQDSVTLTIESRLADYFDGGEDLWLTAEGGGTGMGTSSGWRGTGGGSGSRSCNVDARAAAAWLAGGVDAGLSSILAES
ncbi:unnamed protein product [Ectocarpus sp. 12 AP-2014]